MSNNFKIGFAVLLLAVLGLVLYFYLGKVETQVSVEIPTDKIVSPVDYAEVKDYVIANITEILSGIDQKPANGKWFATKLEFTSGSSAYVDFEDGHFGFRALLECIKTTKFSCSVVAVFESEKTGWSLISGTDTANGKPIIYAWGL